MAPCDAPLLTRCFKKSDIFLIRRQTVSSFTKVLRIRGVILVPRKRKDGYLPATHFVIWTLSHDIGGSTCNASHNTAFGRWWFSSSLCYCGWLDIFFFFRRVDCYRGGWTPRSFLMKCQLRISLFFESSTWLGNLKSNLCRFRSCLPISSQKLFFCVKFIAKLQSSISSIYPCWQWKYSMLVHGPGPSYRKSFLG